MNISNLLAELKIGTRIAVSVGLVVVLLGGAILQYNATMNEVTNDIGRLVEQVGAVRELSEDLQLQTLQAQLLQDDFLLQKQEKLVTEMTAIRTVMESTLKQLAKLQEQVRLPGMASTTKLTEVIDSYFGSFSELVTALRERGLNHESGLQGSFRTAIHKLEAGLEQREAERLLMAYYKLRRHEKDYLLRGEATYLGKHAAALKELNLALETAISVDSERETLLKEIADYEDSFLALVAKDNKINMMIKRLKLTAQLMKESLETNQRLAEQAVAQEAAQSLQELEEGKKRGAMVSAVAILFAVLGGVVFVKMIRNSLGEMTTSMGSSSSEIAAAINQQERISAQQAASLNQTSVTTNELDTSMRQSSEQAEMAASSAVTALDAATGGLDQVETMLQGMEATKQKVEEIAQQILKLSEQTGQIRDITGMVGDFASETKMLAMNAAVEAVRAGEHGKGFAVLAVEIRKLAEESKRSAERISLLVEDIQRATNSTVMVTEEGNKKVTTGMQLADQVATSFRDVVSAIEGVSQSSQQISLNIRQQSLAVQQVAEAVSSVSGGARETAAGIAQIKGGITVLNDVVQRLKRMV